MNQKLPTVTFFLFLLNVTLPFLYGARTSGTPPSSTCPLPGKRRELLLRSGSLRQWQLPARAFARNCCCMQPITGVRVKRRRNAAQSSGNYSKGTAANNTSEILITTKRQQQTTTNKTWKQIIFKFVGADNTCLYIFFYKHDVLNTPNQIFAFLNKSVWTKALWFSIKANIPI